MKHHISHRRVYYTQEFVSCNPLADCPLNCVVSSPSLDSIAPCRKKYAQKLKSKWDEKLISQRKPNHCLVKLKISVFLVKRVLIAKDYPSVNITKPDYKQNLK